jgi:hypothetical protein
LTIVDAQEQGLFGGYLVLNLVGRPLEFYCTAPVRPNRAQEILYGATLKPFLFGEQIGQTLFKKSKLKPVAVCTDREDALAVRDHIATPVMLAADVRAGDESGQTAGRSHRLDDAHPTPSRLVRFELAAQRVSVRRDFADDQRVIEAAWDPTAHDLDLNEPFERIREAIDEARRAGKKS